MPELTEARGPACHRRHACPLRLTPSHQSGAASPIVGCCATAAAPHRDASATTSSLLPASFLSGERERETKKWTATGREEEIKEERGKKKRKERKGNREEKKERKERKGNRKGKKKNTREYYLEKCAKILCQIESKMKENGSSWYGNEEEGSCRKYNKIWMIVDLEDKFRVWEAQIIVKYCTVK
jgi:hypothetical protein